MPNNPLSVFHEILFLGLRPWNNRSLPEAKFKELVREVNNEVYNHQPKYKVAFSNPLNAKRKYYSLIIANGAIHFLNHIKKEMDAALNDKERIYLVMHQSLKPLAQKLKEANNIIEERQLHWSEIKGTAHLSSSDAAQADEAYIIQLVKYNLLFIYLEIQNSFPQFLNDDALSADELHQKFFTEQELQSDIITNADQINLPTPASQIVDEPLQKELEPRAYDIRGEKKGILPYQYIIKNQRYFTAFESKLFAEEFIDDQYNFIKKGNTIEALAAIFVELYHKNYFNKFYFHNGKKITKNVDIRKFLDNRYNVNTDQQFRKLLNNPKLHKEYIQIRPWIKNLPVC
jgi:hypothetical protein